MDRRASNTRENKFYRVTLSNMKQRTADGQWAPILGTRPAKGGDWLDEPTADFLSDF